MICGTHKKIDYYNKSIKKEFSSLDGRFWYKNQRIYTINDYGNCYKYSMIKDYKDDCFYC